MKSWLRWLPLLAVLALAACNGSTPSEDAGKVVERYLQAKVDGNEAQLRELTCAAQESQVPIHANSFNGREAKLSEVVCTFDGTANVTCSGEILVTYDGEQRAIPAGNYQVAQEDGVWRWCGEAK